MRLSLWMPGLEFAGRDERVEVILLKVGLATINEPSKLLLGTEIVPAELKERFFHSFSRGMAHVGNGLGNLL